MNPLEHTINTSHCIPTRQLNIFPRFLFGPGPSNAHPRVLQAMSMRLVSHLDSQFLKIMNETQELLRYTWQTDNPFTISISGTASAAMEACLSNLIESGDKLLVGVNGYFGSRMAEIAERYYAEVHRLECPWGEVFTLERLEAALKKHRPVILGLIHAETSTGICQPLEGIGELCRKYNCILLVDTAASLGGVPLFIDKWQIDAAYSDSQKCLSCPPGISPLTLGERALEKINSRRTRVANWYLDLTMIQKYWSRERAYHHTPSISLNYALREALRIVAEEGLNDCWERHQTTAELLWESLEKLGLECYAAAPYRLPSLTTIKIPHHIRENRIRQYLLNTFNIHIAGGLGKLTEKVWRIGLMGLNSRPTSVALLHSALEKALSNENPRTEIRHSAT